MKKQDKLLRSYQAQKEIYEAARSKRITARNKTISDIDTKIAKLQAQKTELERQNLEDKEFENFESFRLRAESQSNRSKES